MKLPKRVKELPKEATGQSVVDYNQQRFHSDAKMLLSTLREYFMKSKLAYCQKTISRASHGLYRCDSCGLGFRAMDMEVDHKIPLAQRAMLEECETLEEYARDLVTAMFDTENLQNLCKTCHRKKTIKDNQKTKELKNGRF